MNAAFNANKKHMQELEKTFHKVAGQDLILQSKDVPDSDWKERLSRFKR